MSEEVTGTIKEYSQGLFRLILRVVNDREEALDLTQETFIKVLAEHRQLADHTKLKSYLWRTALNLALNARRNRLRRREKLREIAAGPETIDRKDPERLLAQSEQSQVVSQALAQLVPRQRQAVTLRFFSDLTFAEIASVMAISQGSVKVHLSRGILNLRQHLTPFLKEELK